MIHEGAFEQSRLALFARNGFQGQGRGIGDRRGRKTYAIVRGVGPSPTILVHGGLSEASQWYRVAPHLDGSVVIPDRPGCGLSYRIDYSGVPYQQAAEAWFSDFVDGLGADRVNIVANSMGGYFATVFTAAHPERVRRLVFVGAPAGLDRPIPLFLRLWGNPVVGRAVGRMVRKTGSEDLRKRAFRILSAHPERVADEYLEIAAAAARLPGAEVAARTMLRTVLDFGGWRTRMMTRDTLASIDVPTQFIWGDRDAFAPPSSGQDMVHRMRHAAIDIVPDAGHLPHMDEPEIVATAINDFLSDPSRLRAAG